MIPGNRKFLTLNDDLYAYVETARTPDIDSLLVELREETAKFGEDAQMEIPNDQGTLMTILTKLLGVQRALEIGTFTGHSSICIARGLPEDGKLFCLDLNKEWTDVARAYWHRAGLDAKIELHLGDALEILPSLDVSGQFDLVHIDAEKTLYDSFYEAALPLVRPGGLFVFDNMLRGGRVVDVDTDERTEAIKQLNEKLAADSRVETVLLTVGDGIQLCRKR